MVKDILLTGTGIGVIVSQVLAGHPNDALLGTGLALLVPSTYEHIKALLPSSGGGGSSRSSRQVTPPPSSASQEGAGDG
jgi:hypothetical protein